MDIMITRESHGEDQLLLKGHGLSKLSYPYYVSSHRTSHDSEEHIQAFLMMGPILCLELPNFIDKLPDNCHKARASSVMFRTKDSHNPQRLNQNAYPESLYRFRVVSTNCNRWYL